MLFRSPRDIPAFVKELGKHPYNMITGVNTLYNAFLHNPDFPKLDFSKVRVCGAGGMAMQKAVAERWKEVTGKTILEGYGLTETSPTLSLVRPDEMADGAFDHVGSAYPSVELRIAEDGEILARGDVGGAVTRRGEAPLRAAEE